MLLRALALLCLCLFGRNASAADYEFNASRIVAFGDAHGAYRELSQLLIANQVIAPDLSWIAGDTHLVSLGDILDRGPDSRKILDLLRRLQDQAAAAGGRVHVLVGNHEVMNLTGDLDDVSAAEFGAFANDPVTSTDPAPADQPIGYQQHRQAFAPDGDYGSWLLSLPAIIKINQTLFVHGGLPPLVAEHGITLTNTRLQEQLHLQLMQSDPLADMPELLDEPGPLWYRGTAQCHPLFEESLLQTALQQLNADRVVIGHTPTATRKILHRLNQRVLAIDTGMLNSVYKGRPYLLVLQAGAMQVLDAQGNVSKPGYFHHLLAAEPHVEPDIAALLRGVDDKTLNINGEPVPISLQNGTTYAAQFTRTSERAAKKAEALWLLDRQLGIHMVPLTLARQVQGKWGYLELTQGKWLSETDRNASNLARPNYCLNHNDYELLTVFDALTRSKLRSAETVSYRVGSWGMRLHSQHQAFPGTTKLFEYAGAKVLPPALGQGLRRLTATDLNNTLGHLLSRRELNALLKRRDKLLTWDSDAVK